MAPSVTAAQEIKEDPKARAGSPLPPGEKRRWTINGDFTALGAGGVGRYGREVTLAIDRLAAEGHPLARDLEMTLVVPAPPRDPLPLERIRMKVLPEFRRPRLPQVWVQLQLPRAVQGGLVSFCNLAPIAVRHQIVCIHDLQTRLVPESYSLGFRLAHRVILPLLGRRSHTVTTVSEHSRGQLAELGVAPLGKTVVTYNGHEHAFRWAATRQVQVPGERPYVLCLGRAQKHKNVGLLWMIADELDAMGIDIHIGGAFDPAAFENRRKRPSNLRLLGPLTDDELAGELRGAMCFAFPSRTEGFGIPAVEAMALGCPVIASTAACLPEICGDAALYADPDRPSEWVAAIARLHRDDALRQSLRARGADHIRRYSWQRIAEIYLELMARIPV